MLRYTVFVGGIEVNDHMIATLQQAERIKAEWAAQGYSDVAIATIQTNREGE